MTENNKDVKMKRDKERRSETLFPLEEEKYHDWKSEH